VKYFKEALGDTGKVHVSNSSSLTPAFKDADHSIVTPLIYEKEYIPFLLSYCEDNNIRAIISLFDIDLPILSANKSKFEEYGIKIVVSDKKVIDICNDKYETYNFLKVNGFNTPNTYLHLSEALSALEKGTISYPVIIKPRWGMGSIGMFEADNENELRILYNKTLNSIKNSYLKYESRDNLLESVVIQNKLNGQEFGLDIINDLKGNYQNTIVKIKHAMRSGETDSSETINNINLKKLGETLSEQIGHIANIDVDVFLVDEIPYILEINARFGGGYPFSHMAGVDLPKAIVYWLQNKDVPRSLITEETGILAHKDINIVKLLP